MSLKLKWKKEPKQKKPRCQFCGKKGHDGSTCANLKICEKCGEKGHFTNSCPEHTESFADKKARRDEEKKNWDVMRHKSEKSGRVGRSWSRGRSLSSSDDDEPCPYPAIERPFTAEEKERAEQRREWFKEKAAKKKAKEEKKKQNEQQKLVQEAEEELRLARAGGGSSSRRTRTQSPDIAHNENPSAKRERDGDVLSSCSSSSLSSSLSSSSSEEEEEGPQQKKQKTTTSDDDQHNNKSKKKLEQENKTKDALIAQLQEELAASRKTVAAEEAPVQLSKETKRFRESKQFKRKCEALKDVFECPHWASLPEPGVKIEVRKDGEKVDTYKIDKGLFYLFGKSGTQADFRLEHQSISRTHFALVHDGGRRAVYVYDLKSSWGTFVDGKRLEPKKKTLWPEGSSIRVGESSRRYILRRKSIWDD